METIVSGIRSTGRLHLGNYFGAIKNFVALQETDNCFFFIADYHALTTHPNAGKLHESVTNVIAEYLACGLDPEKSTIYLQSDLPETCELYLLLNMLSYKGELERTVSFKEKARKQPDNINAGLLTYPVLMAADILIHKANKVPVGKDQEQHLEMARNFAARFNRQYESELFPAPQAYNFGKQLVKVPGLDGNAKMGKSEGDDNAIYLFEEPSATKKKIMRALTDSGPTEKNEKLGDGVSNLLKLMELVSGKEKSNHFKTLHAEATIRYGDLKKDLAEDTNTYLLPFREKFNEIISNKKYLRDVLALGAEKAQKSAKPVLAEARELMGIRKI